MTLTVTSGNAKPKRHHPLCNNVARLQHVCGVVTAGAQFRIEQQNRQNKTGTDECNRSPQLVLRQPRFQRIVHRPTGVWMIVLIRLLAHRFSTTIVWNMENIGLNGLNINSTIFQKTNDQPGVSARIETPPLRR